MIGLLCRAELVVRLLRHPIEIARRGGNRIVQVPTREPLEVCRGGNQQQDLIRAVHDEPVSVGRHRTATAEYAQPCGIAHPPAAASVVERTAHQ